LVACPPGCLLARICRAAAEGAEAAAAAAGLAAAASGHLAHATCALLEVQQRCFERWAAVVHALGSVPSNVGHEQLKWFDATAATLAAATETFGAIQTNVSAAMTEMFTSKSAKTNIQNRLPRRGLTTGMSSSSYCWACTRRLRLLWAPAPPWPVRSSRQPQQLPWAPPWLVRSSHHPQLPWAPPWPVRSSHQPQRLPWAPPLPVRSSRSLRRQPWCCPPARSSRCHRRHRCRMQQPLQLHSQRIARPATASRGGRRRGGST